MSERDTWILLALLLLAARATTPSSSPVPIPGQQYPSGVDERWLVAGVYWWCAAPTEAQQLIDWFNANRASIPHVKLLGSNGADCAVVLFEVVERVKWPLGGTPEEAPNGMDTELDDLRGSSALAEFFRKMASTALEHIKAVDARIQQWLDSVLRPAPQQ